MADMGWVVEAVVAIIVVAAVIFLLMRARKPASSQPHAAPAKAAVPPASPLVTAAPPPPIPPVEVEKEVAPQTIAAEPTPPVDPVTAVDPALPFETEVAPAPAPAAPAPAASSDNAADNLLRLKGVGPKLAALLNGEGIHRYAQIAEWTDTDLAAIDAKLGSFAGRPKRDNWIDQARLLAAGDVAGYEAKYGKL